MENDVKLANYEKLIKALKDNKILMKSIRDDDGFGVFECETDVWATIGEPIIILDE